MTEKEIRKVSSKLLQDAGYKYIEVRITRFEPHLCPRKHVESQVVEPKQIEGKKMKRCEKLQHIRLIGSQMANLFNLEVDSIFWTYLNKWSRENPEVITGRKGLIWGQHFPLCDNVNRWRLSMQTDLDLKTLTNNITEVIGLELQMQAYKDIERTMIHELAHIKVPIYLKPDGTWSDIHRPEFRFVEERCIYLWKLWRRNQRTAVLQASAAHERNGG